MRTLPSPLVWVCRTLLTLLLPIALVLTNVRLLLTPFFPLVEYNLPGFPADPYGFTKNERLHWANLSLEYLLNREGIDFVRQMRFPPGVTAPPESCGYYLDGDCNRLYNDRELKHMVDVKILVRWAINTWVIASVLVIVSGSLLYYFREMAALRVGLLGGAGLTLALLGAIVLYLLLDFNTFFTQFHQVFFEGDSWLFLWTDTFIRLFPVTFWEHAFIFVGGGAIVEALLIAAWAWRKLP